MTTKEKMTMQVNSEFVCNMMKQRNAGTQDCITSTELAREIGIPVTDMHDILRTEGNRLSGLDEERTGDDQGDDFRPRKTT